jgi:hypothetical protein
MKSFAEGRLKHESIAAFTTSQHIVACATSQPVGISPSIHDIVAAESIDRVLAPAACNEVVRAVGSPGQRVVDLDSRVKPRDPDASIG